MARLRVSRRQNALASGTRRRENVRVCPALVTTKLKIYYFYPPQSWKFTISTHHKAKNLQFLLTTKLKIYYFYYSTQELYNYYFHSTQELNSHYFYSPQSLTNTHHKAEHLLFLLATKLNNYRTISTHHKAENLLFPLTTKLKIYYFYSPRWKFSFSTHHKAKHILFLLTTKVYLLYRHQHCLEIINIKASGAFSKVKNK